VGHSGSVAFDRAVGDYDRTRSLTPVAMRRVVSMLMAELGEHQPCLEIGVGTGRLAIPLRREGLRMAGIDLSLPMLHRLVEKGGVDAAIPVAVADALALPFARASFGGGLACHVLHLIPAWPDALEELARVVRPGGVILVDLGGWGRGWSRQIQDRFCIEAGISSPVVGTHDAEEVTEAMRSLGASVRRLPEVGRSRTTTIAEQLRQLADGVFSFTWSVDEDTRRRAADLAGRWAKERFGSLTRPRRTRGKISWLAFDLPRASGARLQGGAPLRSHRTGQQDHAPRRAHHRPRHRCDRSAPCLRGDAGHQ
jgi:ubiquinone/menaquinone biosynthesis C-methylase UbiE